MFPLLAAIPALMGAIGTGTAAGAGAGAGSLMGGAAGAGGALTSMMGEGGAGLMGLLPQGMPAGGGVMANGQAPNPYAESIDAGIHGDQAKINQAQGRAMLPQGMQHANTYSQAPESQAMSMGGLMELAMQQAPQQQPRQGYQNPYIQSLMGG